MNRKQRVDSFGCCFQFRSRTRPQVALWFMSPCSNLGNRFHTWPLHLHFPMASAEDWVLLGIPFSAVKIEFYAEDLKLFPRTAPSPDNWKSQVFRKINPYVWACSERGISSNCLRNKDSLGRDKKCLNCSQLLIPPLVFCPVGQMPVFSDKAPSCVLAWAQVQVLPVHMLLGSYMASKNSGSTCLTVTTFSSPTKSCTWKSFNATRCSSQCPSLGTNIALLIVSYKGQLLPRFLPLLLTMYVPQAVYIVPFFCI